MRLTDPFLERERERYENPLPSREFVLQILTEQGVPLRPEQLAEMLEITEEEDEAFHRRLRAMERDGQIMRNRRNALCVVEKLHLVKGRVEGHKEGFGFVIPDDGGPDFFLGPREMHKVLHGDRVMVREAGVDRRGRREGKIVEVLGRADRPLVGRIYEEQGIWFFVPEDRRISQEVIIPADLIGGAQPGQVVTVAITVPPSKHTQPIGKVVEIVGEYAHAGMEIEIALRKHEMPHIFPEAVEALAKKLPKKVRKKDMEGREDLRELPLVTIDGEDARDFDDAVYCERKGKSFRLIVAIADVSHYVQHGDALDEEARLRGNSVYFPRRVIPMLPEVLSNGLCSINPDVDRLCMVCDMTVGPKGAIKDYRFYPAVMHSHARFTYDEVAGILADPESAAEHRRDLVPYLANLNDLFHALLQARKRRGAIEFETIETRMIFGDDGKIREIVPSVRNDAHRIIEECMLAANVCASDFLANFEHPTLYRIHQGPTPEKLNTLRTFLKEFGFELGGGEDPHAKDYAYLLEQIKGRPDAQLLQTVLLRSLKQAVYSPENVGHFGLAYESYTHFTSPIRRYPDLLVHRSIKAVLNMKRYTPGSWEQLGMACSQTERRADEASRDVTSWLKCWFMQDHVGGIYEGTVAGVVAFGLFVALDQVYVEGLVHVSDLGEDYFTFDSTRHQLVGERTHKRYRLGDRLKVKVVRVDLEESKVDFALIEEEAPVPPPARKRRRGKGA